MGDSGLCVGDSGDYHNSGSDIIYGIKMRKRYLLFFSLVISALVLLYLLAVNIFRDTFIMSDWLIVVFDLLVKAAIELIVLFKK